MTKPLSLEYEYDDENLYNAIKTYDQNNIYLNELLDSLDDGQRKVIMYKYFSGYSQSEIAKLMNMSQSGVSRTEKKSLEKMRVRSLV